MTGPTERFTGRAGDYVAGRPSYPEEAIDALFDGLGPPVRLRVVDLGAGTGISARLLAARGATVIAVEPNAAMRERAAQLGNLAWLARAAEDTGLESASVDLVTAFQAFHWFDYPKALREISRILRPGGRAALVYNERDERHPFTAAYGEIVRRHSTDQTERRRSDGRAEFTAYPGWRDVRTLEFANVQSLDRAGLHARAGSTSYLPKDGAAGTKLRAELNALFDARAKDEVVVLRMTTSVTTARLRFSPQTARA